jgi:putative ABC transport system substrate-binding protein
VNRREVITLLGGATVPWPLAAHAQSSSASPLIGVLSPISATAATRNIAAFRSALRDLGYVNGRNMTLELRYADGAIERMPPLAAELVSLKPDVLFAGSMPGALAAHRATRTVPIVTIISEDPVASGLATSIAKPGGNISGTWLLGDDALVGKRLEFLKLAMPAITRVGFLFTPDDPTDINVLRRLPAAAQALGLTIQTFEVRDMTTLHTIAAEIARIGIQGLLISHGPPFSTRRGELTAMAARLRLPAVYGFREFAEAGGFLAYGPNLPDIYRQSARMVDRILKGANPADMPFELPTRYELIVNLKTASAMGLTVSDSFLLLADEVIE